MSRGREPAPAAVLRDAGGRDSYDGEPGAPADLGPVPPYVITGGRSRPSRASLTLLTLVMAANTPEQLPDDLAPEHRRIVALCRRLRSVAEVAAHLGLPVSVAKVLIADLLDGGHVLVRHSATAERGPDRSVLENVLVGLRQLA